MVRPGGRRTLVGPALVVLALAFGAALAAASGPPAGAATGGVTFTAMLDGRSVDSIGTGSPLPLRPDRPLTIAVTMRNRSTSPVLVRSVRLSSSVVGVMLFSYSTRIDVTLAPGRSATRVFDVDAGDIGKEATGLLPARLALLGPGRVHLASTSVPVDVRGSLRSVYGLFGLGVAFITIVLLLSVFGRLFAGGLPEHRLARAAPFGLAGLGVGMTLTFSLSALRVFAATPTMWAALIVVGGLIGLAFGFTTPAPSTATDGADAGAVAAVPGAAAVAGR